MNRALAAILITLAITPAASAQTRFEANAEDVQCDWTDKEGRHGTDICHITSQGTAQGETAMAFRIGSRKMEYAVADTGWARLLKGDAIVWEGKTLEFTYKHPVMTVKISDGMTVRLHYK